MRPASLHALGVPGKDDMPKSHRRATLPEPVSAKQPPDHPADNFHNSRTHTRRTTRHYCDEAKEQAEHCNRECPDVADQTQHHSTGPSRETAERSLKTLDDVCNVVLLLHVVAEEDVLVADVEL